MTPKEGKDTSKVELNDAVRRLIESADGEKERLKHEYIGLQHLLSSVLRLYSPMAERLVSGLDVDTLQTKAKTLLAKGEIGIPVDLEILKVTLRERAHKRGAQKVSEQDLVGLILEMSGYAISLEPDNVALQASAQKGTASHITNRKTLDTIARNLTEEARKGQLLPVIGRSEEIELIAETLCRETKRNPLLTGPAGVGKTAIVEGLAYMIHENTGPKALSSKIIYSIQPSSLIAASGSIQQLITNVEAILEEASDSDVILFIDELHSVIGAGGLPGNNDIASLIKPALARGKIACIGATTDDEYRRYIQRDKALERRFQPVMIRELSRADTLLLLREFNDRGLKTRGINVPEDVLAWIVEFTGNYMKNRHFPDKALDLYDQIVANARANDRAVDQVGAETVAQKLVGMPVGIPSRLSRLREGMEQACQLSESAVVSICDRLDVTVRNLDVRSERADAVILLTDEAVSSARNTALLIAEKLYGSEERVIQIDFTGFQSTADMTQLLGAPPGYVGYRDAIELQQLASMPWSVLLLDNIDLCHHMFRTVIEKALQDGFFTDSTGQKIYLSDAVVIMTCSVLGVSSKEEVKPVPFLFERLAGNSAVGTPGGPKEDEVNNDLTNSALTKYLAETFLDEIDVICYNNKSTSEDGANWVRNSLIPALQKTYSEKGIDLQFGEEALQLIAEMGVNAESRRTMERTLEEDLARDIIKLLGSSNRYSGIDVSVGIIGNELDLLVEK